MFKELDGDAQEEPEAPDADAAVEFWSNISDQTTKHNQEAALLFVIAMIPLTLVLRKVKPGYVLRNDQMRINHLLFMDDLTLYGKNEFEIESLVQTVWINNEDFAMEFGIQNCACVILKRGKTTFFDGI